jgi:hypothetical protein
MLKPYGTCMIVEVASNDKLENTTPSPLARIGYAGSIFVCIPTALAQRSIATAVGNDSSSSGTSAAASSSISNSTDNILPLAGMPGISKIEKIMKASRFKFRCTFNNGVNMILEARA